LFSQNATVTVKPSPAPASEETARVVRVLPTPTLLVEPDGVLIAVSDSWRGLLGDAQVPDVEVWLAGGNLLQALDAAAAFNDGYAHVASRLRAALAGERSAEELAIPFPGGRRWFIVASSTVATSGLHVVSLTEITERKKAEAALAHQATHDALTGLPNRGVVAERLRQVGRHQRGVDALETAVLFLDLDGFKAVNDTHGHGAGDAVLSEVARRLKTACRAGDLVARLGGDEFVVIASGLTGELEALAYADRLLSAIALPMNVQDHPLSITASIGVALSTPGDDASGAVLRNADIAMLKAKAQRSGHRIFDGVLDSARRKRADSTDALRQAITDGSVRPWFQPVVHLPSGSVVGAEALVRWVRADATVVPAVSFIPLAESTGLIGPLDRAVMQMTAEAMTEGPLRWLPRCSVNASSLQIASGLIVDEVAEVLSSTGLDPDRMIVEVTETAVLSDPDAAREHLRELVAMGVRIALDDFGTGYSSLSHLADFPIDVVKLDRSFTSKISQQGRPLEIARAVVGLGSALGLTVVAEGVENVEQHDLLLAMGCTFAQGYLYGAATAPEQFGAAYEDAEGSTPMAAASEERFRADLSRGADA